MTPSQRIKIIKECKDVLVRAGLSEGNLVLDEFGVDVMWSHDVYPDISDEDYFIRRLRKADDEKLTLIAEHFGISNMSVEANRSQSDTEYVIQLINSIKDLMSSVVTGGERFPGVNEKYRALHSSIADALLDLGLADPNSFGDLWSWYKKCKDGSLPTWVSRQAYISELYQPTLDNLQTRKRRNVQVVDVMPVARAEPPARVPVERVEENNLDPSFEVMQSRRLKDFLQKGFSLRELDDLAFDLGINPEEFRHQTSLEFIVDLIRYCQRRGRLLQLEEHAQSLRPTDWLSTSESREYDIRIFTEGEEIINESYWLELETGTNVAAEQLPSLFKDMVAFANAQGNQFRDPDVSDKFAKYVDLISRVATFMSSDSDNTESDKPKVGGLDAILGFVNHLFEGTSTLKVAQYAYREYRQSIKARLGV